MPPKRRARGEGSLSQRKSGLWVASVPTGEYDDRGRPKRKQRTSMDYNTAVEYLRQLQRDADDGLLATVSHTTTVRQWLDTWLDTIICTQVKPTTLTTYRAACKRTDAAIGRKRVSKLQPQHVRAMLADIASEQTSGTALDTYRVLSKALGDAKREGLIRDNPCERIPAPKAVRTSRGSHDLAQVRALLTHLAETGDADLTSRWCMSLFTGARQAECLGLTWDRIDLDGKTIDISWTLQPLKLKERYRRPADPHYPREMFDVDPGFEFHPVWRSLCLISTKTAGSRRLVPMVAPLESALRAHHRAVGKPSGGLVWLREGGRPYFADNDEKRWKETLAAAKVPDLTLHSARHTVATLLQAGGVPEATRMAILGHSTAAMARHYAHVDDSLTRQALGQLETMLKLPESAAAD